MVAQDIVAEKLQSVGAHEEAPKLNTIQDQPRSLWTHVVAL